MDTTTRITDELVLKNPVMSASGTFAYGEEFSEIMDLSLLGGIVTKGLSLEPSKGNPVPRIAETPCGMINSIGLENIGIESFLKNKLPLLLRWQIPVVVNFFGTTEDDYEILASLLDSKKEVTALEMNVSCPNIKKGGIHFGKDPDYLYSLVNKVRQATSKTLLVKLSPQASDIAEVAISVQEAGADAITCVNTIPAMAIDENTWTPVLANITGGLSGPAIKPVALYMVWEISKHVHIPIIAAGGAASYRDIIQFMLAGASAVEIGSYALRDPFCFTTIIEELGEYMQAHALDRLADIVGKLKT